MRMYIHVMGKIEAEEYGAEHTAPVIHPRHIIKHHSRRHITMG